MEGHSNDTGLAGDTLGAPREVTGLETETTELLVTTTGADKVDALGANTGVGGLTTLLERSVERRHVRICNWYIESFFFSFPPNEKKYSTSCWVDRIVPLLAVVSALGTSGAALVARIPRNTHVCD